MTPTYWDFIAYFRVEVDLICAPSLLKNHFFILLVGLRSFFVTLKSAWDICIQIKPYNCISINQHGIWSTTVYMRPRVFSKAVQIRNFKSASLLVFKMSHCVSHSSELLIVLLLDQFKSFLAETLASEADGHSRFSHLSSICLHRWCQTARARFTGRAACF
jgi:hypothetical protein